MKKKLLVLVMTGVMTASLLTACGGKETTTATTAVETTVAETTTTAETTEAEVTEESTETKADASLEEDAAIANFDEYLSWTSAEWTAASDDEKLNAAIVYSVYTTEAIGGQTFDAETKAMVIQQMREAEDIQNVVVQLDATLPSFADKTIKEFADAGVEEINKLAEETSAAN